MHVLADERQHHGLLGICSKTAIVLQVENQGMKAILVDERFAKPARLKSY
jgi:hypothetical protein